ncbi:hypothetical protein ACQKLO_25055, partial [Pedobacter suwonensis]
NVMAYGLSKEYSELIVKDGYTKFIAFIEDLNAKIRQGKASIEKSTAYIVGAYQKKGVLPKKEN